MDQTEDPDQRLMLRVRDGDADAFRMLFEKHAAAVARFAAGFTGSAARGEELAQEVFLQVFRVRATYEPRARFTTWLYRIAHNLCLNEIRRFDYRGRIEALESTGSGDEETPPREVGDPTAVDGEAFAAGNELSSRLRALVALLPDAQRTALVLSRMEELRYQAIGEILGCSEQAVKSLVFRATTALRQGLKEYVER